MTRVSRLTLSVAMTIALLLPGSALAATVSVTDFMFTPIRVKVRLGKSVAWQNDTSVTHHTSTSNGANDGANTIGLALWDTGVIDAGATTAKVPFKWAGSFPYHCTFHFLAFDMHGTVQAPMMLRPTTGSTSTVFTIRWAKAAPPSGLVFDVKIKRPGETTFKNWTGHVGISTLAAQFTPDSGVGVYEFKSRLRDPSTHVASGFSPPMQLSVS